MTRGFVNVLLKVPNTEEAASNCPVVCGKGATSKRTALVTLNTSQLNFRLCA
jgi:hypothetical protein